MAEAKKKTEKIEEIKGTTKSGFAYSIPINKLNNYEILDAIYEAEENTLLIAKVITLLLGKDGKKKLMDHLRLEDGTVPFDKLEEEIAEIFSGAKIKKY